MRESAEKTIKTWSVALVAGLILGGCASVEEQYADPRDPFESYNRAVYSFNETLDETLLTPVSKGYKAVIPPLIDTGISNFFGNLSDVGSAVNNLLQFKLHGAVTDVGRVTVNTTIGLLGFLDVASNMDMEKSGEDFGQTLGAWGVGSGPYLVLPFLGPSSSRDLVGLVGDWYTDPLTYLNPERDRIVLKSVELLDRRADLLGASRVLQEAALDPYEFMRDAYLQKRESDVYDGNPPLELYDD